MVLGGGLKCLVRIVDAGMIAGMRLQGGSQHRLRSANS
jgi:hypothetical protein